MEPKQYLTYDEATAIAAEIRTTPGCEFESIDDARGGGEPATGYVVHYWPLHEDGSRKRYLMVVEHPVEWEHLKRIALAHEAKRQRQRERRARGVSQLAPRDRRRSAKAEEENHGPA